MCRSIKILRTPYAASVTDEDMRAAALQYIQTVSGYRVPPAATADAFDQAVETLTAMTKDLLAALEPAPKGTGDRAATAGPLSAQSPAS